jgi:hypothetical protein
LQFEVKKIFTEETEEQRELVEDEEEDIDME